MDRSWIEIVEGFDCLKVDHPYYEALDAVQNLCSAIAKTDGHCGLYGFTSMHTLIITQTKPTYPLHHSIQRLRVQPNDNGQVEFEFKQSDYSKSEYSRCVDPNQTNLQMSKFLKHVGWTKSLSVSI